MKKSNILTAFVLCFVLSIFALADGEIGSGGRSSEPCPEGQTCSTTFANPTSSVLSQILKALGL